MGFTYRQIDRSSIDELTTLLQAFYLDYSYEDLLITNQNLIEDEKQAFFLAYDGNEPVGGCHCALRYEYINGKVGDGVVGYLEAIYVKPAYRLKRIASTLMLKCEEWLKNHDCTEFLSDCPLDNDDSFQFHLKSGFIETERTIFFRKELR